MTERDIPDLSRRAFLSGGSCAAIAGWMVGGVELVAQSEPKPPGPVGGSAPVKVGVIGAGPWGREILTNLSRLPLVRVAAVCDRYAPNLRRAARLVPGAAEVEDPRRVLDDPAVDAVVVATPTHLHRELAVAALAAGKHVYCEAPLAHTIEDARAIARAARDAAPRLHFQAGLQNRSDPQRLLVARFFQSGAIGQPVMARGQWHKKQSWRGAAPTPEREREVNWRLDPALSLGLEGEVGIHHVDMADWLFQSRPVAVHGLGSLVHWREDGREVPDTVHLVLEYPEGRRLLEVCSLATSFDAEYEVYHGSDAAILMRGSKAWMFREVDAPVLGWEVHARTEVFYRETGLVLVANASKLKAPADGGPVEAPPSFPPLYHALEAFARTVGDLRTAAADFTEAYGTGDAAALRDHLATVARQPGAGYREGFESTVVAIQAHAAVRQGRRIDLQPDSFELS